MGAARNASALTSADVVYYGTYPQSGTSDDFKVEPVLWRVLEVSGDKTALTLSEKILDGGVQFNPNRGPEWACWWSESQIRKFLNGKEYVGSVSADKTEITVTNPKGYSFYDKAFSAGEGSGIIKAAVDNSSTQGAPTGPKTTDKIFLLSYADVDDSNNAQALGKKYGFVDIGSREAELTDYSVSRGVINHTSGNKKYGIWWLRSPGNIVGSASSVRSAGYLNAYYVDFGSAGLRPAFRLNLKNIIFTSPAAGGKDAGVVTALQKQVYDGIYTHIPTSRDFTEHKLTLATNTYKLTSADLTSGAITAGTSIDVSYSGASTGAGYHLAAVVTSGDRALYYGRIKSLEDDSKANGTATFVIPEYHDSEEVYIFVEGNNNNGDGKTDFAGVPVCLTGNGRDIKALSPDVLPDLKSISVAPSSLDLAAGQTATLNVGYSPVDAKEDIGWISSAPDIVSVDGAGKLTAHKAGTATITATTVKSNITDSCTVTVTQPSEGLNLNIPKAELIEKDTMEISAFLYPVDTSETISEIEWRVSDEKILKASALAGEPAKAKITALAAGRAFVTAKVTTSAGTLYEKQSEITVTAKPAPGPTPSGGSGGGCNAGLGMGILALLAFVPRIVRKDKNVK